MAGVANVAILFILGGSNHGLLAGGMLLMAAQAGNLLRRIGRIRHAVHGVAGEGVTDLRLIVGQYFGSFGKFLGRNVLPLKQSDLLSGHIAIGMTREAKRVALSAGLLGEVAAVRRVAGGALPLLIRLMQHLFFALLVAGEAELVLGRDQLYRGAVAVSLDAVAG